MSKYIYIIDFSDRIKIGITSNIKQRFKSLSKINNKKIELFYAEEIDFAEKLEFRLHYIFEKDRIEDEYYNLEFMKVIPIFMEQLELYRSLSRKKDILSILSIISEYSDIDFTVENIIGKAVLFDSRYLASYFKKKHYRIVRILENILESFNRINETGYIFSRQTEYRNQEYCYYVFDISVLFIVIHRFKGRKWLNLQIDMINFGFQSDMFDEPMMKEFETKDEPCYQGATRDRT